MIGVVLVGGVGGVESLFILFICVLDWVCGMQLAKQTPPEKS